MTTRTPLAEKRHPASRSSSMPTVAMPMAPVHQALHRAIARSPALRPADVLHLQRTIGNRAVGALLTHGGAAGIQRRKRFASEDEVKTWVAGYPVDRDVDRTAKKYFTRLKAALGKPTPDREDLTWLETVATQAWSGTSAVERKTLSASGWQHIWRGDVGSGGYPSGFHWKGKADDAYSEGYDEVTNATDAGFYKQAVRYKETIATAGTGGASMAKRYKADASTFFPDDWTEQEVKDAVELRNSKDEITKPAKGLGVKLIKSGETIYPSI